MKEKINRVALATKEYFKGDEIKAQHFARVYTLSKTIGELEKLPIPVLETLVLSSIVHEIYEDDIEKVKELLVSCDIDNDSINRVCFIVEHKNDYEHITGLDHQILVEADFIVHIKEENMPEEKIIEIGNKYFFTNYGRAFLKKAFGI